MYKLRVKIKTTFLIFAASLLAGCASSSQTYTPDGRVGYSLNCSGNVRTWGACEQKAGDICGARGYEILSKTSDNVVLATDNSPISRSMLIVCK